MKEKKMQVKSDIEIARSAKKLPIQKVAEKLKIPSEKLIPYGHDKAKISSSFLDDIKKMNVNTSCLKACIPERAGIT